MTTITKESKQEKWEKSFDKKFPYGVMIDYDEKTDTWEIDVTDDVKDFIRTLLTAQKEKMGMIVVGGGAGHDCKGCCVCCSTHHALEILASYALEGRFGKKEDKKMGDILPYGNISIPKNKNFEANL